VELLVSHVVELFVCVDGLKRVWMTWRPARCRGLCVCVCVFVHACVCACLCVCLCKCVHICAGLQVCE